MMFELSYKKKAILLRILLKSQVSVSLVFMTAILGKACRLPLTKSTKLGSLCVKLVKEKKVMAILYDSVKKIFKN